MNTDSKLTLAERALLLHARALQGIDHVWWLAPLAGRLAVGLLFLSTGWGKVQNTAKVAQFFAQLGIVAPHFNAVLVGYTELIGGTLLVLGLLTRPATLPLMVSMIVAILTARRAELHGLFDLVGFEEFTYLTVLLMIALIGPGAASLDAVLLAGARRSAPGSVGVGQGQNAKPTAL